MTERVECVVVGAGVIGLAIARAIALQGREVLVLEAEKGFGRHTSSRNSEVIHAGIYYPTDSLKARTCVSGKAMLYDYCQQRGVNFRRIGKLIVASRAEQIDLIRGYQAQGRTNGVDDLELLSKEKLHQLEPEVRGLAALWSPSTGIVDSHGLMLALLGDFENAGGTLVLRSPVGSFRRIEKGYELEVEIDGATMKLQTHWLINSAGHGAVALAKASGVDHPPRSYYPAGHYFSYTGKSPLKHLVYPVADAGSLGVHATLDLGGQLKFGPDLEWRDRLDYTFNEGGNERGGNERGGNERDGIDRVGNDQVRHEGVESRQQYFETRVREYFPGLEAGRLQPGYIGIRPRITGPGEPARDFVIADSASHGMAGLIQLFGIESPGLTASLAIAEDVVKRLNRD